MNKITIEFNSNRPLTEDEQDCILIQIENAICEPQTFVRAEDGTVIEYQNTDWYHDMNFHIQPEWKKEGETK